MSARDGERAPGATPAPSPRWPPSRRRWSCRSTSWPSAPAWVSAWTSGATGDLVDEHRHVLRAAETFLDIISVGSLAALGTTLVLVALLRGRVMVAVAAAAAILGANLTTQLLKRVLERPDLTGPGPSDPPASRAATPRWPCRWRWR